VVEGWKKMLEPSMLGEQSRMVSFAVENPDDLDPVLDGSIKEDVITNRKAIEAWRQLIPTTSDPREGRENLALLIDHRGEALGGCWAVPIKIIHDFK
jgi:hypothetical protein